MVSMTLKLAQRATQDHSLMASLIDTYSEREKLGWDEIANQLWVEDHILAKLALCRRPRPAQFAVDVAQISNYVGINHDQLTHFIRDAEVASIEPAKPKAVSAQPKNRSRRFIFSWAFAVALLIILIVSAFIFSQPGTAAGTMIVLDGDATIIKNNTPLSGVAKQTGKSFSGGEIITLETGDKILVDAGGYARLQLQDGTTIEMFENTELTIEDLNISEDTFQVRYRMLTGKTINRVRRLLNVNDFYEVITPSSTVSVRGTVFTVQVISDQITYVSCDEGVVQVTSGDQVVYLNAGEEVIVNIGEDGELQPQPQSGVQPTPVPPGEVAPTNTLVPTSPITEPTATPVILPTATPTPGPTGIGTPTQPAPAGGEPEGNLTPGENTPQPTNRWEGYPENAPPGQGGEVPGGGNAAPPGQGVPPGHQKTKEPKDKK